MERRVVRELIAIVGADDRKDVAILFQQAFQLQQQFLRLFRSSANAQIISEQGNGFEFFTRGVRKDIGDNAVLVTTFVRNPDDVWRNVDPSKCLRRSPPVTAAECKNRTATFQKYCVLRVVSI